MAIASLAGLLFQSAIYPTEGLRQSFISNDVVNLFIGLPALLGSKWFARPNKLIGLLLWPGALLYVTYNYIAYVFAMPFAQLWVLYLSLTILSLYTLIVLLMGTNRTYVKDLLNGAVSERFSGGVLIGFGALFFLRSITQVFGILTGKITVEGAELGVLTANLLTTPLWVISGILLWQKRPLGYATGAGLLFQVSMLFVGLLIFFILQPLLSPLPFRIQDFVVILVMGLICFVPFGLFIQGVLRK